MTIKYSLNFRRLLRVVFTTPVTSEGAGKNDSKESSEIKATLNEKFEISEIMPIS